MAVMIEAISVVIRTSTLKAKYPGGVWEYMSNIPNGSLCVDKHLTRVGFMVTNDVAAYIQGLETFGLTFIVNDAAQDIVVVDQKEGFTTYCDWAVTEFVDYQGVKLRVCRHIDDESNTISFPYTWSLENSLYTSELRLRNDEEAQSRLVYLRNQGGSEVYFDKVTGKEVYLGRAKSDWGFDRES